MAAPSQSSPAQLVISPPEDLEALHGRLLRYCTAATTNMADCRRVLMLILCEIRRQSPADGPLPPVSAGAKPLVHFGAVALNYVAEAAKRHYGQETPAIALQRWTTPRVRRLDGSTSRHSLMSHYMDRLMSATQTGNVRPQSSVEYQTGQLDSSVLLLSSTPRSTSTARRAAPNSDLLDPNEDLLDVAWKLLTLSCADLTFTDVAPNGSMIDVPIITDINEEWKETAFRCVELTLTGLARWLSALLRRNGASQKFELFGQIVPGTDCHLRVPPHCPPRDTACAPFSKEQKIQLRLYKDMCSVIKARINHLALTPMPSANSVADGTVSPTYIPHVQQTIRIIYYAIKGPKVINGGPAIREWQLKILKLANFALIHLDKVLIHFFSLKDDPPPAEIPNYNLSPLNDMSVRPVQSPVLAYVARREYAIEQCLHDMYVLKAYDPKRIDIMPSVLCHSMGHNSPSAPVHKHRPDDMIGYLYHVEPTLAWRREKLALCRMALVGGAQTLSAHFGETKFSGADVKLWEMVVPQGRGQEMVRDDGSRIWV